MEQIVTFFEFMPAWQKLSLVVFSLATCWILEKWSPLFHFEYSKIKHGGVNLTFFLGVSIINLAFSFFLVRTLSYFQDNEIGLLQIIDFPIWAES